MLMRFHEYLFYRISLFVEKYPYNFPNPSMCLFNFLSLIIAVEFIIIQKLIIIMILILKLAKINLYFDLFITVLIFLSSMILTNYLFFKTKKVIQINRYSNESVRLRKKNGIKITFYF